MTSKHTPGPRTYSETAGDHDFLIYPESGGPDVALVRDFDKHNARLIAAAPELLAALPICFDFLDANYAVHDIPDVLYPVRAAIRKATEG